jgi:hypothetical protein
MPLGQIDNMDVIAHSSAVRRRIVVPINLFKKKLFC